MTRAQRVHTFTTADLAMSDALGVQARALCGVWVPVGVAGGVGAGDPVGTADDDDGSGCMRCAASVRRIIRDKAVRHA